MTTALSVVERILDETYPEVGRECPMFPVMVVLFSAAILGTASMDALLDFTGYSRNFLHAITINMVKNRLWKGNQYKACKWLKARHIDDRKFFEQVDMACGLLWKKGVATEGTPDPTEIGS